MGMLTEEQFNKFWSEAGFKYRVKRLHIWLSERGLLSHITEMKFSNHMYELLEAYLVKGIKETEDGRTILPTRSSGTDSHEESEDEGR